MPPYPGAVQLPNDDVYCAYYEEGARNGIRGQRLRVTKTEGIRSATQ